MIADAVARIRIKTYGCAHNRADSETMAGLLAAAGHRLVERDEELLIVNGCAVKSPSEERFRRDLREATVPVLAAGCVVQGSPRDPSLSGFNAIGTKELGKVVEAAEATLRGEPFRSLLRRKNPPLGFPRLRRNPLVAIIPVASGCRSGCAYCKTVHARGRLESHPVAEVVAAVEAARDEGAKEVWLTAEDVGAYGADLDTDLVALLDAIAQVRGSFMVRVGMANPAWVEPQAERIAQLLEQRPDRFFRFLHLPIQSGSETVLQRMRRGSSVEAFEALVARLRLLVPEMTIATDMIVGFPGETEEEHEASLALIARQKFPVVNISQFYPRPGTAASRMRRVPSQTVKRRSREMTLLFESQDPNTARMGRKVEALFTARGPRGSIVGHTLEYVQVVVPREELDGIDPDETLVGRWVVVDVTAENKFFLTGKPIVKREE